MTLYNTHISNGPARECVILDYTQRFESDNNIPSNLWLDIVIDSNDIFHGFSYLIRHLLKLIDDIIPCDVLVVKYLSPSQRRDFYIELSKFGIKFRKARYFSEVSLNSTTDIIINTTHMWSVYDYRLSLQDRPPFMPADHQIMGTSQQQIYHLRINIFNQFYDSLNNNTPLLNNCLIVSLRDYVTFKRIWFEAKEFINSRNNVIRRNNIINFNNHSNNKITKHILADLVFDIKETLTDSTYKTLLDKISEITI